MRIEELHRFSDGTFTDVRTTLDDRLKGIRMQYLPKSIWRKSDKDRAAAMIRAIDKRLKTRRIIRSLERSILMDLQVTSTKPGRMTKPYSSHHFIANCFNAGNLKMKVKNGVVERRNCTLIEAARTMLIYAQALLFLWAEAVATACYTQNRSIIRLRHGKTPYELRHNKLPDLSFLHVFGALCYPTNDSENLGKLQPNADIGIFIGYVPTKKAFRIYNRRTRRIVKTIHVDFDEVTTMASEQSSSGPALIEMTPVTIIIPPVQAESTGWPSSTLIDQDAPSPSKSQTTAETQSVVIPQDVEEDNLDIKVAHMGNDPLFGVLIPEVTSAQSSSTRCKKSSMSSNDLRCGSSYLVQIKMVITLKWIYKVKLDELGGILKNKARLVARGYRQEEGIVFEESFAPVARLEAIRIFLAYAAHKNMVVYQMDVKTVFLNGSVDPTLFIRRNDNDLLLARPTKKHVHAVKRIFRYLRGTVNRDLWYPKDSSIALIAFADADHAGCQDTHRSTSGSVQFLGERLISWSSKRQKSTAISSTEAEYIALSRCCTQIIWTRSQLSDYDLGFNKIPMYCDNKSGIALCCNNVQHSRSKNIDIRYHFIKEQAENEVIELYFVNTEYQLADLSTKALGRDIIEFLINKLGMRSFTPETLKQLMDEVEE
nr:ribonuclease H-like domain-containing protein [Tanacetum cinerariifolium]